MTDIKQYLAGQVVAESPEASAGRAYRAMRDTVKHQGEVMSSALQNSQALWHTNKELRSRLAALEVQNAQLRAENLDVRDKLERLGTPEARSIVELRELAEALAVANNALQQELVASQYEEIDSDGRHEALKSLKAQRAELFATGLVPTPEQVNARLDRGLKEVEADPAEAEQLRALAEFEDEATYPGVSAPT